MTTMTRLKVIEVTALENFVVRVRFNDGTIREIDLRDDLWGPVFAPLRDPAVFRQVRVDEELGTLVWPNGTDLAPYAPSRRQPRR